MDEHLKHLCEDRVVDMDATSTSARSHISWMSRGSKKSSSTLSSLLSNKSMDLVFGLIDEYYQSVYNKGPHQPSTAELLGNFAPSSSLQAGAEGPWQGGSSSDQGLDALVAAADVHEGYMNEAERAMVVRATSVADADGKRLEELAHVLTVAQEHANSSASCTTEHIQRIDSELVEVRSLLTELKGIRGSFSTEQYFNAVAPKLAALAHWQERVLNNALVARVRLHTGGGAGSLASPGVPTASQFIQQQQQQCAPRPVAHTPASTAFPVRNAQSATSYTTLGSGAPPLVCGRDTASVSVSGLALPSGVSAVPMHDSYRVHAATPMMPPPTYYTAPNGKIVAPRKFSLDNKIEMMGGGSTAHDPRRTVNGPGYGAGKGKIQH